MIVHSVEASPRVGRAFDRPPFELLSSVRRCMALLWCCAERQLDEGAKLGQRTCGAHVPFLGHVHILLDSYTEFRVVCISACERGQLRVTYTQQHIPLWRDPCWLPVDPTDKPRYPIASGRPLNRSASGPHLLQCYVPLPVRYHPLNASSASGSPF
jgi:hypothetical protein